MFRTLVRLVGGSLLFYAFFTLHVAVPSAVHAASTEPVTIESARALDVLQAIQSEKGKVVLVNFFASWCPPCKEEIPDLIALKKTLPESKVTFLGVSLDEKRADLEAMTKEFPFNYRVLHASMDVASTFNIGGIPRLLIYDKSGKLVVDHVGLAPKDAIEATLKELMDE